MTTDTTQALRERFDSTTCTECGMCCKPGEFHPFAACLMFKACHDGDVVRANLSALATPTTPAQPVAAQVNLIDKDAALSAIYARIITPVYREDYCFNQGVNAAYGALAATAPAAQAVAQTERDAAFSDTDLNLMRMWFEYAQDHDRAGFLETRDFNLAVRLYRAIGWRVPHSVLERAIAAAPSQGSGE
jgi:hypothetical protein